MTRQIKTAIPPCTTTPLYLILGLGVEADDDVDADGEEVDEEGPPVGEAEGDAGGQFNRKNFDLSFGLKNGLRFHFDSDTCVNYQVLNFS